uniref:Uncharacterized protein n=1 Tax=Arundo donax TaxID=35708 RepID=A0A0A9AKJ5_ARUDO
MYLLYEDEIHTQIRVEEDSNLSGIGVHYIHTLYQLS